MRHLMPALLIGIGIAAIVMSAVWLKPPVLFIGCCWIALGIHAIPPPGRRRR